MSQHLSDYFALESGEFLDQLDGVLTAAGAPDLYAMLRLARGIRGSARLAGAGDVADVAERLELAARALGEGTLAWSEDVRARAVRTADDIRVLIRTRSDEAGSSARAREAVARWDGVVEARPRGGSGAAGDQLLPFVRREVVGVITEIEIAVEDLQRDADSREPLRSIVRRMRPLRGMTGVTALGPVLEILEGVEDVAQRLASGEGQVPEPYFALFAESRRALQGALVSLERNDAASADDALERFRDAQDALTESGSGAAEADVVPITSLFHADGGPHVVSSPIAPAQSGAQGSEAAARFVGLEATGFIDRAEALLGNLPAGREGRFARVAAQLSSLARSVGELADTYGLDPVGTAARCAADDLQAAGSPDAARGALVRLRGALGGGAAPAVAASPSTPAPSDRPGLPAAARANAEDGDAVPIESILLRGAPALRQALALRDEVDRVLASGNGSVTPRLPELVGELFELVRLGLDDASPAG